jgi:RHS repeat-associated protein
VYSSYDTANHIMNYIHDGNGNITWLPNGTTLAYDVENRVTTATVSGKTETYYYAPDGRRVYRKATDGTEYMYFYRVQGERLPYQMGSYVGQLTGTPPAYFAGRRLGWGATADRLGSVRVAAYYPYGEYEGTAQGDDVRFATYVRDSATGLDYAVQRYYSSTSGRFLTPDPWGPSATPANPQSWNRYTYVLGDPVNNIDPSGLDVSHIDIGFGTTPTCLEEFTDHVSVDLNAWLNSDQGTMALQVYWEHRGTGTSVDRQVWTGIANVFRNRWHLTNEDKRRYGFTTSGFKQLIYSTTGTNWNKSGTPAANQAIWSTDGKLKSQYRNELIRILNSSPTSSDCNGMITAFRISDHVYNARPHDESVDTTSGALFFFSTGSNNPIPENPFGRLNYDLMPTAIIPVSWSAGRSVVWIFYTPTERWSY